MKSWSDTYIHNDFIVKIFCDTNILIYLIDNTYPSLNKFVRLLVNCPFTRVVSSKFVIFEFVGVRKREHYLRIALERSENSDNKINLSSLIKYIDSFSSPDAVFSDLSEAIQSNVTEEVEKIISDFSIDFEYSEFHKDQLQPTFDVCLGSKLNNQDSLVLVSAVLPSPQEQQRDVFILTNDSAFISNSNEPCLTTIFSKNGIPLPKLTSLSNFSLCNGNGLNLTTNLDDEGLENSVQVQTINYMKQNNFFLGEIIVPENITIPNDIICFKLKKSYTWKNGVYITILGKKLDFIYTIRKKINHFEHKREKIEDNHNFTSDGDTHIAFEAVELDELENEKSLDTEILNTLKEEGNLVFINPDS